MIYLRKASSRIFWVLFFVVLVVLNGTSFNVQGFDPRLRLKNINGQLHCSVCEKK